MLCYYSLGFIINIEWSEEKQLTLDFCCFSSFCWGILIMKDASVPLDFSEKKKIHVFLDSNGPGYIIDV